MKGRVLAIDLGSKRVGVAISDELRLTARPLRVIPRTPWKRLVNTLAELCREFDVKVVVLGLPLGPEGVETEAASEARRVAGNLNLSLKIPVHLQDERLTSKAAEASLRQKGFREREVAARVDGEAAAIILSDFLSAPGGS